MANTVNNTLLGAPGISAGYTISAVGGGGGGVSYSASRDDQGLTVNGTVRIVGDEADIKVNTKSMKEWMEAVEKRLAILTPNIELNEKYEALREAYEHYKTLEALLYEEKK